MKVLIAHNYYQQPGGEDIVFEAEARLLSGHGHDVLTFRENNRNIRPDSFLQSLKVAGQTIWSQSSYNELAKLLRQHRPDVVHFHNTFPRISPSAYYACREMRVPVVQTLHNYRVVCPAATLFRDGRVCEECVHHSLLRSVRYGCYRQSRPATAAVAAMLAVHRQRATWDRMVDCYIVLTEFARQKLAAAGLPQSKLTVKPNFLEDRSSSGAHSGNYALFAGRLTPEKGLATLLEAWSKVRSGPLWIAGDGPLQPLLHSKAPDDIKYLGWKPRNEITELMKSARFLVFPSQWYEGFPMTIVEAYACGTPVVASALGSMREIVDDGLTGLHFIPGNADDLARKVAWAWSHPREMQQMGINARQKFEANYTAEKNVAMLTAIYESVAGNRQAASGETSFLSQTAI